MTQLTCTGAGRSAAAAGLPDYWTFNVITTGAGQTYTLNAVGVNALQTCVVDWGDGGATENWTGDASRSHVYAGTGNYTVTVTNAAEIWKIDMRDSKTSWTVSNAAPMPANITYLYILTLAGLTWNVGSVAGANMPAGITYLYINNIAGLTWNVGSVAGANMPANITDMTVANLAGLTWNVGSVAGANMPANITYLYLYTLAGLTWDVGSVAGANMPAGITYLYMYNVAGLTWNVGSVAGANMPANCADMTLLSCGTVTIDAADVFPKPLTTFRFENSLTQAQVDVVLAALYLAFPTRTGTNGTIDLAGGGNAAPTGVSPGGAECPPTTGWNTAYELVNDSCGVSAKHWASVTCQV